VPETTDGLLLAAKNIGLTRIAASTYRLHPVEFQIGQAAGAAAAMCVKWGCRPRDMWVASPEGNPPDAEKRLRRLQYELLKVRTPLYWNEDCGWDTDRFMAVQWVCSLGLMAPRGPVFDPDAPLTRGEAAIAVYRLANGAPEADMKATQSGAVSDVSGLAAAIAFLRERNALEGSGGASFDHKSPVSGAQFALMLEKAANANTTGLSGQSVTRAEAARILYGESLKRYGLAGM